MSKTAILVATYNGRKVIEPQLNSFRNQELQADYVIFRDDLSTDGTVDYIKAYIEKYDLKGWTVLSNEKNLGWRNNFRELLVDGLKTDADYLFYSDQDNIWFSDKDRKQVEILDCHPEIELLSTDIEVKKVSEDVDDLPNWFSIFQFEDKEKQLSKYPERIFYSSYRVGWVDVMRRGFVSDMLEYWKADYNITHDVLNSVLASLLGTGYNLNEVLGTHLLHGHNATGKRLLTAKSPKSAHLEELYKLVGFYDVLYHILKKRGLPRADEMKSYYDFYVKRHRLAQENKTFAVFAQILTDWKYYPAMSGRVRDVIFAFKR